VRGLAEKQEIQETEGETIEAVECWSSEIVK
jgi:hypothetical protein